MLGGDWFGRMLGRLMKGVMYRGVLWVTVRSEGERDEERHRASFTILHTIEE